MFQTDRFEKDEDSQDIAETKIHYAVLQSELTGEVSKELERSEKLKYSEDVDRLTKAIGTMELDLEHSKKKHEMRMVDAKNQYTSMVGKLQKITYKLMNSDNCRYIFNVMLCVRYNDYQPKIKGVFF